MFRVKGPRGSWIFHREIEEIGFGSVKFYDEGDDVLLCSATEEVSKREVKRWLWTRGRKIISRFYKEQRRAAEVRSRTETPAPAPEEKKDAESLEVRWASLKKFDPSQLAQ